MRLSSDKAQPSYGLALIGRGHAPTPTRNRCMLDNVVGVAGVVYREARTPFGVAHHRRPELWVVRQAGVIGRPGQQRDETQALFTGYVQSPMLGDHVLVAAQGFGVGRRTAHHLAPPRPDVAAMLITTLAPDH